MALAYRDKLGLLTFLLWAGLFCTLLSQPAFAEHVRVLHPSQVPLPASAPAGSYVHAVYSPYVVKSHVRNEYLMFFGVSIACQNGNVARDSIAVARSPNAGVWTFSHYIIEPNPTVCLVPVSGWLAGALYQVNDPSVVSLFVNQQEYFYVTYTAVHWNMPVPGIECGGLGVAVVDQNLRVVLRNDQLLFPDQRYCGRGFYGFSRPAFNEVVKGSSEIWFDSGGIVMKIPFYSLSRMSNELIQPVGLSGLVDVDVFTTQTTTYLISNGANGLLYWSSPRGLNQWTPRGRLTSLSGDAWDRDGQGSAHFFLDPDNCVPVLYHSGVLMKTATEYDSLSIGYTRPENPTVASELCSYRKALSWY